MTSLGTCDVSLASQGKLFVITVSFLALKRSKVVLGCDWLQRLADISVNFDTLKMSFSLPNDEKCQLVGNNVGALKPAASYNVNRLMTSGQPTGYLLPVSAEQAKEETHYILTLFRFFRITKISLWRQMITGFP